MPAGSGPQVGNLTDIAKIVAAEARLLLDFIQILETEQQALVAGEVDRLMPLSEQKSQLAGRLADFATQRNQTLASLGLAVDRAGMDAWLARQAGNSTARNEWRDLLSRAAQARNLNEINGKLISERLRHNQQALAVLLSSNEKAALYGPDGQQRIGGGGRILGSA